MKPFLAISFICLSATGFAEGYEEKDARLEAIYPFKQQAYDLCSGHGLMHLSDDEMRDLCDRLARNLDDVRALQENPRNDRFLSNLTGLITRSEIPQKEKRDLLRRSYEISEKKSSEGDEWPLTVAQLIDRANVLSIDEISSHLSSENAYLRGTAARYLEENSGMKPKRPEHRPAGTNPDGKAGEKGAAGAEEGTRNLVGRMGFWIYCIAGGVAIGLLGLILMAKNRVSQR